jgi:uncharacterized SAM-binding protein YcdF (DUF218 family)
MKHRRLLIAILLATSLLTAGPFAFTTAGTWLVVKDRLQPARSVVVLGGQLPFRAAEAAALYNQGWAREVWLTQGGIFAEDIALGRMQIDKPPEHVYSQRVLERLGVPRDAIRVLPERNVNTADEVRAVARELTATGGGRVILVTSKYHTRRVKIIWRALAGSRLDEVIVRYASDDPFQPRRWWRNTSDALLVSREWLGLFNVWAGFPVSSERW